MAEFFNARIIHVYLIYGLGFFVLGLAVALEIGRLSESRFSRAMPYLAAFGLLHGTHEWVEMLELLGVTAYGFVEPPWWGFGRLVLLSLSFGALVAFGVHMLYTSPARPAAGRWATLGMLTLYTAGALALGVRYQGEEWMMAADAWTRYALGVPGALLAAAALRSQWQILRQAQLTPFAGNFLWAAIVFALYGAGTQIFVPPSDLLAARVINSQSFLEWTGVPVQAVRSILAALMALFMIRGLRAFEVERQRRVAAAEAQAKEAIARRDALRGELLRRTVTAQEEERARLARELHDDTLQVLTGLSAGLKGTEESLATDLERARGQLARLSEMSSHAIEELRRLIVDLRPTVLDDMGLVPAVRWYAQTTAERTGLEIEVANRGIDCRLPDAVETILFRTVQEGLNNVARHAQAKHVVVRFQCDRVTTRLEIEDDGVGFEPAAGLRLRATRRGWGLVGIQERVALAGGEFEIESAPNQGTILRVAVPSNLPDGNSKQAEEE
jgi:signal transduction histidine kinase